MHINIRIIAMSVEALKVFEYTPWDISPSLRIEKALEGDIPFIALGSGETEQVVPVHLFGEKKSKLETNGSITIEFAVYFQMQNGGMGLIDRSVASSSDKIIVHLVNDLRHEGILRSRDEDYELYELLATGLRRDQKSWWWGDFNRLTSLQELLLVVPRGTNLYDIFVRRGLL